MKIYLAGAINGCTDSEAKDWRAAVKEIHTNCLDPMARDYRGKESESMKEIVEGDKADIDQCEGMVVYYERPSAGTCMEIIYAWEQVKTIVVIDKSGKPLSPWVAYHATKIVYTIPVAIALLTDNIP